MQNLLVISLSTIQKNARLLKERSGVKLIAVVKDEAYGHGGVEIANALSGLADGFAVSTLDEAVSLRIGGVTASILLLSPVVLEEEAERALSFGITASLSSIENVKFLSRYPLEAHLAVNTGMNRYGVSGKEVKRACESVGKLRVTGIFSHLFLPEDRSVAEEQKSLFSEACEKVEKYFPNVTRHLSATGGVCLGREYSFDAVRCGLGLYGYLPKAFRGAIDVQPCMEVYSFVSCSPTKVGKGAGYALEKEKNDSLYTLRVGYGDGVFRSARLGVNPLCMDACVCSGRKKEGELVRIIPDLESFAEQNGTIVYEVLTSLKRFERKYV